MSKNRYTYRPMAVATLWFHSPLKEYRIANGMIPITFGSAFGKRDLLAFFHVMKYDVKCGTCLSNAANHFKIFLIELEICLYKHLYFLYIRNPLFPIAVFISMLWKLKVNMFYPKIVFPIV